VAATFLHIANELPADGSDEPITGVATNDFTNESRATKLTDEHRTQVGGANHV